MSSHGGATLARSVLAELVRVLAPRTFAAVSFIAGVTLLADLLTPGASAGDGMRGPLLLLEASHFFASLAATLMLLLSLGLWQRMRAAWAVAVGVFAIAAALSIAAERHIAFAGVFAGIAILLVASRGAFYRAGLLNRLSVSAEPVLVLAFAIGGLSWLGFFSYRNVEYSDDLWWTFAVDADASRFLRALVVTVAVAVLFLAWRLFQPAGAPKSPERTAELDERLAQVIDAPENAHPDAALAYLPDKRFHFSDDGRAFVMYGVRGRNWICMGPPVGPPDAARAAAFALRREADRVRANLIFYAAPVSFLPLALDLGLSVQKVGEAALIDLPTFSLEGSSRARLRQVSKRATRDGCVFEVLPAGTFDAVAEDLGRVSRAWLDAHQGAEKRFTLGNFDADYLRRFPLAVVKCNGALVAFANIWRSGDGQACSVDLMRHAPDAPSGVMDFLFVELALWAKAEGMKTLDLGMAPLAGLAPEREADMFSRLGVLVYSHGEEIYGFEGLRKYKDKFDPRWEPVYLAAPDRVSLMRALVDVALLTSGGVRGLLR